MMTPTHALMAATLGVSLKRRGHQVNMKWLVLGGLAPDVGLLLLSLGYFIALRWFGVPGERVFGTTYDTLYFTNPIWIIGYNGLHAPLMILALAAIGYYAMRNGRIWGNPLIWFAVGCSVHSIGDIFTHHFDGPLLLFPFNWNLRFMSPISYWDPRYYGDQFAIFEFGLNIAMILYLLAGWLRRKFSAARADDAGESDTALG
ncbi:MAG: metal-dependent hydrolase [Chloroflexaceae bacterium]|nr:metal-dependent hydrolase [Chloroflexaceae bacterium]NJO06268.1 metal-dependent hydrolase [Chloroflexaceae bacterium]